MRILLDECAPRPLKREVPDYEIHTSDRNWRFLISPHTQ